MDALEEVAETALNSDSYQTVFVRHIRCKIFAVAIALVSAVEAQSAEAKGSASIPKFASAIYAPQPKYPISAGLRFAHGTGLFVLRIRIKTGRVTDVSIVQSTGHKDLDAAAIAALRQWRFKPGALPSIKQMTPDRKEASAAGDSAVKVPVTFEVRW